MRHCVRRLGVENNIVRVCCASGSRERKKGLKFNGIFIFYGFFSQSKTKTQVVNNIMASFIVLFQSVRKKRKYILQSKRLNAITGLF
jgi:hypothetical protein